MEPQDTIFLNARQIADLAERAAYLTQACGNDADLRQRVEAMLRDATEADEFFGPEPTVVTEGPGTVIGRYKLLQQIGEGGMGVVYMAEQREPVLRKVALKIIKLGMDTKQVIARFEAERQALALMDHPNIAKVLDGGATESGRPYFVMELVPGLPITQFCDEANLSTRDRLELFLEVCSAIQHAHQKGIIHRDIKPSNILVTLHGDKPVPKVIDFGVAKATQGRLTEKTLFTQFQQFIGTPAYMSPEQASLSGLDIDTRSDIYALGVLLYELLTGRTPLDAKELLKAGLDEMRRTIREKQPPRPSNRISTLQGEDLTTTAKQRRTDPPKLIHLVRGDLDWIVMKALEKDRARRYETANGLAMDIKRHLSDEPIVARPPSTLYRFQKSVQRNKLAFAAASAVAAALIIGLTVSTWMFFKEREARQRAVAAEREEVRLREEADKSRATEAALRLKAEADEQTAKTEATKAQAVTKFLQEALSTVNPQLGRGKWVLVRDVLDDTARKLDQGAFEDQPDIEASLRRTVGITYSRLGLDAEARPHLEKALALRRRYFGAQPAQVAESLCDLAMIGGAQAKPMLEEALAIQQAVLGPDAPEIARTLGTIAYLESDQLNRQALYREALRIYSKAGLEQSSGATYTLHYLALAIREAGDPAGAIPLLREALDKCRRFGRDESDLGDTLLDLAFTLNLVGQREEVESMYREALACFRDSIEFAHGNMQDCVFRLSEFLTAQGQPDKAEAVLLEQYALLTGDPRCTPQLEVRLLQLIVAHYKATGRTDQAAEWQQKLALRLKVLGPEHPDTVDAMNDLANAYDQAGRHDEAVKLREQMLALDLKMLGPEHPDTIYAMDLLANLYYAVGRDKEAIALLEQACESNPTNTLAPLTLATWQTWLGQDAAYEATRRRLVQQAEGTDQAGTAEQAAKAFCLRPSPDAALLAKALTLARQGVELGKSKPWLPWYQMCLGLAEYRNGQYAAAEQALTIAEQTVGDNHLISVDGQHQIQGTARLFRAMSLFRQDKLEEARKLFSQAEAQMPPLPKDESKPFVDGRPTSHDDLIWWLAYKEAKALIEGQPAATSQ